MRIFAALLLIGVGAYTLFNAIRNSECFFDDSAAKPLVKMLGRSGARVFM